MVDAPQLEHWDRCRRMWAYLDTYRVKRITPLSAVYQSIAVCLQADSWEPKCARELIMEWASKRGVQTDRANPYDIMVNHAHMAECLTRVLRQPTQEPLKLHPQVGDYQPRSYLIDGGMRLLRVVLVDRWDENRKMAELHSWGCIGDICVTGLPMTIRVMVIGSSVNGKRAGYWCRGKLHPYTKRLQFRRKQGKDELVGEWRTVWREESKIGPEPWIEQMARDGVLRECAFDIKVRVPDQLQRDRVLEDIERIGQEMAQARKQRQGQLFPMTRSSCDDPILGPCRFQCVCYAPIELTPEQSGLFERRDERNGN